MRVFLLSIASVLLVDELVIIPMLNVFRLTCAHMCPHTETAAKSTKEKPNNVRASASPHDHD